VKKLLLSIAASLLAACACNKAAPPPAVAPGGDVVVATWTGGQITLAEVDKAVAKDLYDLRREMLETTILKKLVDVEAKKAGKSDDALLQDIAKKAAPPPTDEEMKAIYEGNKDAFGGRPFEDVKPAIIESIARRQSQDSVMAYLEGLRTKAQVKILLTAPRIPVQATGPSKGPQDAPVTIVEFSDFQCPFCSRAKATADQVVANYAGKVRLVFRDYPLPFHEKAQKAAEAGKCAEEQQRFWEMHDWMFANQDKLEIADIKAAARELGVEGPRFDQCLDSGRMAIKVQLDGDAGKEAGVSGTPAFFINGRMLSGAQPLEKFREIIDDELARK
jgi:protein-disulfide isomerase